ncbi:MAG: choice-of-anchor K domain-containing protein, partial [Cyanobacteria bacterium J06650_10]
TDNHAAICEYQTDAGKGCADKITWDWSIDESSSFMYEGEEYTLELVGFSEQVAASSIVNEFISQENGDNSAGIFARLVTVDSTKDIPEPASLLGLAGLALFVAQSRKKRG